MYDLGFKNSSEDIRTTLSNTMQLSIILLVGYRFAITPFLYAEIYCQRRSTSKFISGPFLDGAF